ncbi:MAG TPA: murein biosynthesis integral membrane protein MurJ [Clostridia bacterium]|nr:murein biosynthesis integral membrane protein MurJ [Clostridia bacterium]
MNRQLTKTALLIVVINLLSRLLGFGREAVIANQFGATSFTDAYLLAYTLPYFLQAILGMALVSAIVPVVTKYLLANETEEAWRIASITLNWTTLFMALFALLGILGAKYLVFLTAPGFNASTRELAISLTKIMFPSVIFMAGGMLLTGILNAKKRFAVAAFAPGFSSLIIILTVILLGQYGIHYLAWGTLLSMLGGLLIQVPVLKQIGFRYYFDWRLHHPEVKGLFYNLLPIFLGTAVNQIYLMINRFFASGLGEGSISALNYAGKLMNLPMGIFALAISTVIFPLLSEQAVQKNKAEISLTLLSGLQMVLLITLPAAAGLMALRTPIVQLLFERGAFDQLATQMTAGALFYFCWGMFASAMLMVITRAYYALGDVWTPLFWGMLSILVNIGISIAFLPVLAHRGLALANSLAAIFNALCLYLWLKKHLKTLYGAKLLKSLFTFSVGSLFTGLAAWQVNYYLGLTFLRGSSLKFLGLKLGLSIGAGVLVYGLWLGLVYREAIFGLWQNVKKGSRFMNKDVE